MNPMVVFLMWSMSLGLPMSARPGQVARVKVDITAGAELKTAIHGYLAQGFQSSGAVEPVDEDPGWTIKIVTLTVRDDEGNVTAVGLSVVVLEHGPQMNMLRTLAQAWHYIIKAGLLQKDQPIEVGMRKLVAGINRLPESDDLTVLSQHRMCLIPVQKLGEACRDIVTSFNAKVLQSSNADRR